MSEGPLYMIADVTNRQTETITSAITRSTEETGRLADAVEDLTALLAAVHGAGDVLADIRDERRR